MGGSILFSLLQEIVVKYKILGGGGTFFGRRGPFDRAYGTIFHSKPFLRIIDKLYTPREVDGAKKARDLLAASS